MTIASGRRRNSPVQEDGRSASPQVRAPGEREIILYELNEVPWQVVDLFVQARPDSHLANLLAAGQSLTTVNDDPVALQPWRTWPTLHTSSYTDAHNSFDLGQDPDTFSGVPLWDVAESAGLAVGLFGVLQSWPARSFAHGGFYVPDTFSRTPATVPAGLRRFQEFNLSMTQENSFSSDRVLNPRRMVMVGLDLLRRGLTASSLATLGAQLALEVREPRYKGRRPLMQVLPSFDLYWKLHRRFRPRLSIFFTNHVAGMMHRYWGDWVADYVENHAYAPDKVFAGFVLTAMDVFDRQLGRIRKYMAANPGATLLVAASMGQGPIEYHHLDRTFVLEHPDRLIRELGLPPAEPGLAMYPRISFKFDLEDDAERSIPVLKTVTDGHGRRVFRDFTRHGTTASFEIGYDNPPTDAGESVAFAPLGSALTQRRPEALGIATRRRVGGGNTAYHVPEGILLAYGAGLDEDRTRRRVNILDVAPSVLADLLNVQPPSTMKGTPGLFGLTAHRRVSSG